MGAFYLDIKKDLLDKILSGVYPQGSIIPNEYELAEIYKVSRPTVRKAVQILVGEGYLEKRKKDRKRGGVKSWQVRQNFYRQFRN